MFIDSLQERRYTGAFQFAEIMVFLPAVLVLYWALPHRFRKYLLLAASYYFYMCWKPEFIVLILFSTAVNYFCALCIRRYPGAKKPMLIADLIVNFGLLFFFKYLNFFGETLTALCGAVSIPFTAPALDIILPVGISFYTFQTLSYTIDVYRGKMEPERDFITFALFVSYFPQLVAGPIERADNLLPQLKKEQVFRYDQAAHGVRLMVWGFFKKCVCAAYLSRLADAVYNDVSYTSGGAAALATAAFALQIYCDFGGYSDIARGCSEMMGVELMVNFKAPYFALSMRDFWKRWHISLTSWFREYVYFPLGGSRRGFARTLRNTLIVFALSGLWHGASWTFVVWGLLHALYLCAELIWNRLRRNAPKAPGPCCKALLLLKTFVLACIAWTFFRADTMADALAVLGAAFAGLRHPLTWMQDAWHLLTAGGTLTAAITVFSVLVLLLGDLLDEKNDAMAAVGRLRPAARYALYVVFLLGILLLIPKTTAAPFIYFQF